MSAGTTAESTLGNLLRQTRLSQELSLRKVAAIARVTPMYLSLLERDECGPPSDEKLLRLSEALGKSHAENFFAKAGRITPKVVNTILRNPTQWSELIEAGKDLDGKELEAVKEMILDPSLGTGSFLLEALSQVRERMSSRAKTIKKRKAKRKARERADGVRSIGDVSRVRQDRRSG